MCLINLIQRETIESGLNKEKENWVKVMLLIIADSHLLSLFEKDNIS